MLRRIFTGLNEIFHRPIQVFWICVSLAIFGVLLDGTAFRLWSLNRDHRQLLERIASARSRTRQLGFRIQSAQQPEFIEKAARDQFDLVKDGDLIFIFSDELLEHPENAAESSNRVGN